MIEKENKVREEKKQVVKREQCKAKNSLRRGKTKKINK